MEILDVLITFQFKTEKKKNTFTVHSECCYFHIYETEKKNRKGENLNLRNKSNHFHCKRARQLRFVFHKKLLEGTFPLNYLSNLCHIFE